MDTGYRQPFPDQRRHSVWPWIVSIIILALVVYWVNRASVRHAETSTVPVTVAGQWGDRYCYAGLPRPTPAFRYHVTVLTNTGYLVGYCETRRDPVWAAYRLFRPNSFQAPPRPKGFDSDYRTSRTVSHDYTGSGYDRGHMAPNYAIAVCYGTGAQLETFLMSNIIPQRPALNRQVWEHLEQQEIREYAPRYRQIWIVDGPIFRSHDRLRGGEEIPDACFKIICREQDGQPKVLAFIMPQTVSSSESPGQFLTSVREIERETGLDFFSGMPEDLQQRFETEPARGMW